MLPPRAVSAALKPLRQRGIELVAAVRGDEVSEVAELLRACDGEGVRCGLWPMLSDREGRWPSRANVARFASFTQRMLDAIPAGVTAPDVAVDLEPPFGQVSRWLSAKASDTARDEAAEGASWTEAVAHFDALARRVRATGGETFAAVIPMCLYDPDGETGGWQRAMGTPVDAVAWDRATVMLYTSIFEGWSRSALTREDARFLLADGCRRTRARFGPRGGVSLGAVSTGALGNEPTYRGPDELADDVALCAAEGIDDITLFDYAGVLRRGPLAEWLDALVTPPGPARAPRASWRVRTLVEAAAAAGRVGGGLMRRRA